MVSSILNYKVQSSQPKYSLYITNTEELRANKGAFSLLGSVLFNYAKHLIFQNRTPLEEV
jgi:hypothetical protein